MVYWSKGQRLGNKANGNVPVKLNSKSFQNPHNTGAPKLQKGEHRKKKKKILLLVHVRSNRLMYHDDDGAAEF